MKQQDIVYNFRISSDLLEKAKARAAKLEVPVSKYIRSLIKLDVTK